MYGHSSVTYWIEVVGPADITVPLDFSAHGAVSQIGGQVSVINVSVTFSTDAPLAACSAGGEDHCPAALTFGDSQVHNVPTNTPIEIQLSGNFEIVCCGDGYFGGAVAQGTVTTRVAMDPNFKERGYLLFFSANASPTPASLLATLQDEIATISPESLDDKAEAAQSHLRESCRSLKHFVQQVERDEGKKLSAPVATQLLASAHSISALLGCQ